MKNQYFADVNDYRKYGLLRLLAYQGAIRTAVCWMLTVGDGSGHGGRTAYVQNPDQWRGYDPELFDSLARCLVDPGNRQVGWAEQSNLLPSTRFYSRLLTDDAGQRRTFFHHFLHTARGCDLVFYDPDTGLEVESRPYGRKGSCQYLYWHELLETYRSGHSVLVYQHFPRVQREPYIQRLATRIGAETAAAHILSFRTTHVVFFLAPQPRHLEYFRQRARAVALAWASQITVA